MKKEKGAGDLGRANPFKREAFSNDEELSIVAGPAKKPRREEEVVELSD